MKTTIRIVIQFIIPAIMFGMSSCKHEGGLSQSDHELIEENIRAYFFMGDTVELEVSVADTVFSDELEGMLAMIDTNLMLIKQDIDTVNSIIDALNYADRDEGETTTNLKDVECQRLQKENPILFYQLKLKEMELKKLSFQQSNRIYLHLKRSTWANVSGYEVNVHYKLNDQEADLIVLMDADFKVVD